MKVWLTCLWVLLGISAFATDTLHVGQHFTKSAFPAPAKVYEDATYSQDADLISSIMRQKKQLANSSQVNYGYRKAAFWFQLNLTNTTKESKSLLLSLENTNIDSVHFYVDYGYGYQLEAISGDHVAHSHWQMASRQPTMRVEIKPGETLPVMVRARNSFSGNMILPVRVWEHNHFLAYQQAYQLIWGIYFGFLLINIALSFSAMALLRANIFVWYALFLIASLTYAFISFGFLYEFITHDFPGSNDVYRTYSLILISVFMLRFSQRFLNSKQVSPGIHLFINIILVVQLGFLISSLFILDVFRANFNHIFPWFLVMILLGYILILTAALYSRSQYPLRAHAFLLAFGFSLLGGMTLILTDLDFLPYNQLTIHAPWIGNGIEIIIFTGIMFYEFKIVGDQKIKLEQQIAEEQTQRLMEFFRGQEKERHRIARDLHDNVAGTLVGARFLMPNPVKLVNVLEPKALLSYERALYTLDRSIRDVRNLSHNLQPPALDAASLQYELERLIADYRTMLPETTYTLEYALPKNFLNTDTSIAVYRVCQECLLNVFKHANAKSVRLQLFHVDHRVHLYLTDDGKGFDESRLREGIGLQNIRSRLTFTANLETSIESAPGKGTKIRFVFDKA